MLESGNKLALIFGEGLRRLGLTAGFVGGGLGLWASYGELSPLLAERTKANLFHHLASSAVVQEEVSFLKFASTAHPASIGRKLKEMHPEEFRSAPDEAVGLQVKVQLSSLCGPDNGWKVNKGEVIAIYFWGRGLSSSTSESCGNLDSISDIQLRDGQRLYSGEGLPPQTLAAYAPALTYPAAGFFMPWGALKILAWVSCGFSAKKQDSVD